ncbi:MAG: hypothetical protein C0603_08265 [Denitrovibrio sp.]|nr:MAG: hypothetical protein C0603_08265 [Denitrovibrio sp.]
MNIESDHQIIFFTSNHVLSNTVKECLEPINVSQYLRIVTNLDDLATELRAGNAILTIVDQDLGSELVEKTLKTQKEIESELPLIIITEKEKQEDAAELIEKGADDYITRDNLKRLVPVIRREVKAYKEVLAGQKARQEIKELTNIIQSAEDEIYILGGDSYKIKFANKKALQNLGYNLTELYGKHIQDIAEEITKVNSSTEDSTTNRVTFNTRFIRKDGSKYPAQAVFQTAETDGSIAILGIVHDTTEKESVKQHTLVLNMAIDASASAVTVIDEKQKIVYANKAQLNTAGATRQEFTGKNIVDVNLYESSGLEFFEALQKCRTGDGWIGEYQKTGDDGSDYIVLGSISPVLADGINVTNIVIVEEDITERVRIKSQLLHAQKMETVGELTSGIAHDFTNMLTAIGGFASIMKRKMDKDSRFYSYVERISDITVRAKSLTQNLLTFSRKEAQAEKVICVNVLIKSVGEFLSMVIGNRIEIEFELLEDDVNILGDPVQLEQVIVNLATNARDAIENDGKLTITVDKTLVSDETAAGGFQEYAVISVRDNGCGIPQNKIETIFEPFFTTKKEGKGTGLGLYIVSDIISRHKGTIECYSEEGDGTEFTIKLPITEQKIDEPVDDSSEVESIPVKSANILLVEDEKIVRESLSHALDVYGYEVSEAVNGKEALDIFKEKHAEIDLVVSDIVMPVMSGISAYKEMKTIKPDMKIIFTTGYVGEAHRKEGFNEEDHIVMLKPLIIKELVKKIEELLA